MGYTGGSLADIAPVEPMIEAARRTTARSGALLKDRVREFTPVAKPPPGAEQEWLRARGRIPGTLRESWQLGHVEESGTRFGVEVYTHDPVAPHVEFPTRPHLIRPKPWKRSLRWWDEAGLIHFALLVHHPGTQGSYMMQRALTAVGIEWQEIGAEEMRTWARETQAMI